MTECVSCAKFKGCDLSSPNVNECADYKEILTNDEWRRTCSTEEFAEFLTKVILDDKRFRMTMVGGVNETKLWLKQPHSEVAE